MAQVHTEQRFEDAIEVHLLANEYLKGDKANYDRTNALDTHELLTFIQTSQPKRWAKLANQYGSQVEQKFISRVVKELEARGTLAVLRHGIVDLGVHFDLAYQRPAHELAPEVVAAYQKNRLSVTRQVAYSLTNANEIDLVLFVNGIPVATAELKNPLSGQNVQHAIKQYQKDRDPRELLFSFKKRCLVHFAVDTELVYMTTRLTGDQTEFLPFNQGDGTGAYRSAGNPINPKGYKTAYLWEQVWQRDAWMDILGRFIHLQKVDPEKPSSPEAIIFPRYHQLECVLKVEAVAGAAGAGDRYLIQHSAGSGKSATIAWLGHGLFRLHDPANNLLFDSVIVITDRKVLDRQLQDTIYQFEHKQGVVERIDKDSKQLADALTAGRRIIITTLQKFPFVMDKVADLTDRSFCVIVDEAHSSQTGEAARKLRQVLSGGEAAEDATEEPEGDFEDELSDAVLAPRKNVTFVALTATPKAKTIEIFGTKDAEGKPRPFHLYSMRQAIEEGFILDVLQNYTTYKTLWRLEQKQLGQDPEVEPHRANQAIARFVSLHPHNVAQKAEVIIEHFRQYSAGKIGGRAKGMVVTRSRRHAVRFKEAIDKYIATKGYDLKTLVAFSGTVTDDGLEFSESQMNDFPESQTAQKFDTSEYSLLIVAEKYQTGFDQPLLHSMYVDKRLDGVKAVQTLSRLNRIYPGKVDTFVLDFVNEADGIREAFRPYYDETEIEEPTDPNLLYDFKSRLDGIQVYWQSEVDAAADAIAATGTKLAVANAALNAAVDPAVNRYLALPREDQEHFRHRLQAYVRLYSFLTHILPFADSGLTKLYEYGRFLLRKLPSRDGEPTLQIDDYVALRYYRLAKVGDYNLTLRDESGDGYAIHGPTEVGTESDAEAEKKALSELIQKLNEHFGMDLTEADQLTFDQYEERLVADPRLAEQAKANDLHHYSEVFGQALDTVVIDQLLEDQRIAAKIQDDPEFKRFIADWLIDRVYQRQRDAA
jgi:type I restriction enzyme R subunit